MTEKTSVERFLEGNGCSQAILAYYCTALGLDEQTAMRISAGFPAGMQMAGTCGAVTGAYMVLGLRFADQQSGQSAGRKPVYEAVAEFTKQFKERNNTLNCRELLGCDIMTPEGKEVATRNNLFKTVCPKFVEDASQILQAIIKEADEAPRKSGATAKSGSGE